MQSEIDPDLAEPLDFQILQPTDVNPFMMQAADIDSSAKVSVLPCDLYIVVSLFAGKLLHISYYFNFCFQTVEQNVVKSAENSSNDDAGGDR